MTPSLTSVMQALYASEINCFVFSFWDNGWLVKLGDSLNGFRAERTFPGDRLDDAAAWLIETAKREYPDSEFAKHW